MGQKVNPIGFRVTVSKDWRSRWFTNKVTFSEYLLEDIKIRSYLKKRLYHAGIARIQIERSADRIRITIHAARPGLVFGRKRAELDNIKAGLAKFVGKKEILIDVVEIKNPEIHAQLLAENIALQIERRIHFRRAMKRAIQTAMTLGAGGIKIRCSGRLNESELARSEEYKQGKVPLHTLRADIEYGFAEANTRAGKIGIKTWIYIQEEREKKAYGFDAAKTSKTSQGPTRKL